MQEIEVPLQQKLAETRRRWRTVRLFSGLGWALCTLIVLSVLCYYVDRVSPLSPAGCILWRNGIVLATLASLLIALSPLLRPLPDTALAVDVERAFPVLHERLLTTLELAPTSGSGQGSPSSGFSSAMISALSAETQRDATGLDFRRAVNLRPLRLASGCAFGALLLFTGHIALAREPFTIWMSRMAHPYANIAPFAATRVWLTLEKDLLPRGEGVGVSVTTRGAPADHCVLHYRADAAQPWQTVTLSVPHGAASQDTHPFAYRFPALNQSLDLFATANDGRSNEQRIQVEDRPTLLNLQMTLHFPAYMHRSNQVLSESTGNITAPVGTEIELHATANKALRSAVMTHDSAPPVAWHVSRDTASGNLSLRKDGTYSVMLTDPKGFTSAAPPRYELRAIPDQTPTVEITHPAADIDLVANGSLPLVAHASDDYGVTRMSLLPTVEHTLAAYGTSKAARESHSSLSLPGATGAPQADAAVRWSIADLKARPGEYVRYLVEAADNDSLEGPHIGRSQVYRIHIIEQADMQQRLKEQLDEELRARAQLHQRQQEAQAQTRQAANNAALAHAQDMQRSLTQETQSLAQRAQELSAQLENNNMATPSELQRRNEAAQTLQSLAQQKMPDAANRLDHAQSTPAERSSALAQATHQQEAIQHDIERTQQLLARPESTKNLADQTTELALKQQQLAESARNIAQDLRAQKMAGNKSIPKIDRDYLADLRKHQAETNEATQSLQQQLERAAQNAAERGQKTEADALQRAAASLRQGQATSQQQQAQSNLQRNDPDQASRHQDRAADALQKAADAAREAAAASMPDTPQTAQERLDQAAQQLQDMANKQNKIAQSAGQSPNAAQSQKLSQQERALQQQAQRMQSGLQSSPSASQSLQNAQSNMQQAQQQMGSSSAQKAASSAAKQLQQAAQQAAAAAQQLKQQQAASELQERVAYLAQVQRGLHEATQRLHRAQQHDDLSDEQKEELSQVADRQKQNAQDTLDLARKMPSPSFKDALHMAANQMEPAVSNLNQAHPNTDSQTQKAQDQAAQTLDTIAQALKQQAQGGSQNGSDQSGSQQSGSPQQAQQAAALGDLMLSRGLQRQVRQNTGALDQARAQNPDQKLTDAQKEEANRLAKGQRMAQSIAGRASDGLQQDVTSAVDQMRQASEQLGQLHTGQPAQEHQDQALHLLDHAIEQAQQQQQQQQQQQSQQGSQMGMPQPNTGNMPGKSPLRPLDKRPAGKLSSPNPAASGVLNLSARSQRTLQQGQQERVPPEFQDWVSRYYRSLSAAKKSKQ